MSDRKIGVLVASFVLFLAVFLTVVIVNVQAQVDNGPCTVHPSLTTRGITYPAYSTGECK